jgi:protein TonB
VTSIALPPLDCSETRPSLGERLGNGAVVVALHLLLGYAALYLSVKNDLIQLPPSISVRLLPMMEEKKVEPPKPLPPPPKPVRRPQPVQAQPVLAVTSKEPSPSSFAVAPQPPAPTVQPIAAPPAPPAPPVAVVAARFDADYLHNPKPVYPALSRRNAEEGKVLLKVRVSAQGTALDVAISKSSTFARLDKAAAEAVAQWRFVPARRGDEPVESSVIVPITFALE